MSFNKEINLPKIEKEQNINNPDLKIINAQLAEAIKAEDYEQAAILRDLINSGQDTKTLKARSDTDSPEGRVLRGVKDKKEEKLYEGEEIVEASELFYYINLLRKHDKNDERVIKALKNLVHDPEIQPIDNFLSLRSYKEEAERLVALSGEKFNSIWQPYREKAGLLGEEYNEYTSSYSHCEQTIEKWKKLREVPTDLAKPLRYWQSVYDNSRLILDKINEAAKEAGNEISKY